MKKIKILYWIFTIIFSGLMIYSAIPNIAADKESVQVIHDFLGYPVYFIPFIGWAKLIGSLVILVPGLNKIKEWAYAGLFFDLATVVYSGIAASKMVDPRMSAMLIWIVPGILSYYCRNKMQASLSKQ